MVYAVEQGGRNVYCSSASCVSELLRIGWRLSEASQLTSLVRELAAARSGKTHEPSDHFH